MAIAPGPEALFAPVEEDTPGPPDDAAPPVGAATRIRGPFLFFGGRPGARAQAQALAAAMGVEAVERRASDTLLGPDPVLETMALLREAVFVRVRLLKKVFEGRVMRLEPARAATATPPPVVELVLATDDDERPLRLDGGFATAFWASGADVGDIVQIDKASTIVSLRRDRERSEGWVHEERDFVYRLCLGEMDRSRHAHRAPLLGTGRMPPAGVEAMRATDAEVETLLGTKGTRLEPGLLMLADAEDLPEPALALVAASVGAPGAPVVLLQTDREDVFEAYRARFDGAVVLGEA